MKKMTLDELLAAANKPSAKEEQKGRNAPGTPLAGGLCAVVQPQIPPFEGTAFRCPQRWPARCSDRRDAESRRRGGRSVRPRPSEKEPVFWRVAHRNEDAQRPSKGQPALVAVGHYRKR